MDTEDLAFKDYYEEHEVRISTAYDDSSPDKRKQLRTTLEMQKMREKEVQSVDEEIEKTDSVVIERF